MQAGLPSLTDSPRNGWWRFESRNNEELEESFQEGRGKVATIATVINFSVIIWLQQIKYTIATRPATTPLLPRSSITTTTTTTTTSSTSTTRWRP